MNEPLTPEQARAKIIAELMANPGLKPLKPIPPEEMAWALADLPPEEERLRQYQEMMENGGHSFEEVLAALDKAIESAR